MGYTHRNKRPSCPSPHGTSHGVGEDTARIRSRDIRIFQAKGNLLTGMPWGISWEQQRFVALDRWSHSTPQLAMQLAPMKLVGNCGSSLASGSPDNVNTARLLVRPVELQQWIGDLGRYSCPGSLTWITVATVFLQCLLRRTTGNGCPDFCTLICSSFPHSSSEKRSLG